MAQFLLATISLVYSTYLNNFVYSVDAYGAPVYILSTSN